MGTFFFLLLAFIALLLALAKWDAYEQSPQGSISVIGNVSGAEGVDPLAASVVELGPDSKITINGLASIPIERVRNVRFHKTNNSVYAGGGHRVNRYFGWLEITYENKHGRETSITCKTTKKNQIGMIQQYENMKKAIDNRRGIEKKKIETPTQPYEL